MRGKKADPLFVSQFVKESIKEGARIPNEIVERAKAAIAKIDEEIKAIEVQKTIRSKLLDVIASFDCPTKNKTDDINLLSFFKLSDPVSCKFVCDMVKNKPLDIKNKVLDQDKRFAIKQLIECGVLYRDTVSDQIKQDTRFNDYMKFVLFEV